MLPNPAFACDIVDRFGWIPWNSELRKDLGQDELGVNRLKYSLIDTSSPVTPDHPIMTWRLIKGYARENRSADIDLAAHRLV